MKDVIKKILKEFKVDKLKNEDYKDGQLSLEYVEGYDYPRYVLYYDTDEDQQIVAELEVGDVIELMYMDDPYNPISPLTRGVVMGFEGVPGGEDKILVTWIIDPENDKMYNMPMIPEVDVWRKVEVEPPATQNVTGRDSRDSIGYPLRDVEARYQNWKRIKDKEIGDKG